MLKTHRQARARAKAEEAIRAAEGVSKFLRRVSRDTNKKSAVLGQLEFELLRSWFNKDGRQRQGKARWQGQRRPAMFRLQAESGWGTVVELSNKICELKLNVCADGVRLHVSTFVGRQCIYLYIIYVYIHIALMVVSFFKHIVALGSLGHQELFVAGKFDGIRMVPKASRSYYFHSQ